LEAKKSKSGVGAALTEVVSPAKAASKPVAAPDTRLGRVWEWYRIGLAAGIGAGLGLVAAAWLAGTRVGAFAAPLLGAAAGVVAGLLIDDWNDAIGGAIGGVLGGLGGVTLVSGALRRGGTRSGIGVLVSLAGLGVAALALTPFLGYLEALVLPGLAVRARRREPDRYAGLRTLAKDS
jgi:hypothetical protein